MKDIVISLGGSILCPKDSEVNIDFLKKFKVLIDEYIDNGSRFIIFIGGGKLARKYQDVLKEMSKKSSMADQDWIGIMATRLNAELLRSVFCIKKKVIYDPILDVDFGDEKVLIGAGWKPGWSTDFDAVKVAINIGSGDVINISNISHVYDKDPNVEKDAKPFSKMSWKKYRKMVGNDWKPGLNAPFDPIASKIADENDISVHIVNDDLGNLRNVLEGKEYVGTTINKN